jgi:hypothetical protein
MIRRILTLAVAFPVAAAVLLAGPAFADRRDVTTTIGVDENGVTIKIDAALTGGGRATGRRGGSGGVPCQYDLANIGAGTAHLYRDKPLDVSLFAVACGSYVDVRWLRVGPNGQPLQPGPTVDPFLLALSARDRLPVPQGAIDANPTRSLVGLPTLFWYSGYDGRPLTRTTSAFGVTVQVEATPTSYRWAFGDGASLTSEGLGRAYPARSPIAHTYQTARQAVRVRCRFAFAVRWRTGGGPWAALPPLARAATTTLEVAESQTVIAQ